MSGASSSLYSDNQLILKRGINIYGSSTIGSYFMGKYFSLNEFQLLRNIYNRYLTAIGHHQ